MIFLKTFEHLINSPENNINTYIKTFKDNIDFDIIVDFLNHMKDKRRITSKTNHMSLFVFSLRQINNTVVLKKLWEIFFDFGFSVIRKDPEDINILTVLYRDHIRNHDSDYFYKYKNIISLLFDNNIDLLTKRTSENINFFDILNDDDNLNFFLNEFSNNVYFMENYKIYKKNIAVNDFNL